MSEEFVGWLDDEWNVVLDQSQPIVRCRDCVHYDGDEEAPVCKHPRGFHQVKSLRIDLDGFCAWNERRKP